jgi:hypothetical protein
MIQQLCLTYTCAWDPCGGTRSLPGESVNLRPAAARLCSVRVATLCAWLAGSHSNWGDVSSVVLLWFLFSMIVCDISVIHDGPLRLRGMLEYTSTSLVTYWLGKLRWEDKIYFIVFYSKGSLVLLSIRAREDQ